MAARLVLRGLRRPPPLALPIDNGASLLVRALRSGRGPRRGAAAASERAADQLTRREEPPRAKPQPLAAVPAFVRVRALAKLIRVPADDVLKRVATRANRRFHMALDGAQLEFKNVKQILLPFQKAREVAASFGVTVAYDEVEPAPTLFRPAKARHMQQENVVQRRPVVAVMGHVDHGKTTLMDTLRLDSPFSLPTKDASRPIAPFETRGITQKINVCDAALSPTLTATFLDTPGHFHFFRMRSSAAQVADLVILVVAADEGVRLQTEESIGAIEESGIPAIVCINKLDLLDEEGDEEDKGRVQDIVDELRSFVALQRSPIIGISGKTGLNLDELRSVLCEATDELATQGKLGAYVGPDILAEGIVLESTAMKGRGMVLKVLLKHGVLKQKEHFIAGMIHGSIRDIRDSNGKEISHALPGMVVDVIYGRKSKYVDAPNEFGFYVLPEERAKQVIEQRQMAMDFEDAIVYRGESEGVEAETVQNGDDEEDEDEEIDEEDLIETKSIIVKADQAGSLTSIQDTVDEIPGISTVRIGIGNISAKDIDVAINGKCPIFGFNVKLRHREARMAAARGVRVVLRSTVHELIEEITAFEKEE